MKITIQAIVPFGVMQGNKLPFTGELFEKQGIELVIGKIGFSNSNVKLWKVYEKSTGMGFTGSHDTKKEALAQVEERFVKFGVEKIKNLIANVPEE